MKDVSIFRAKITPGMVGTDCLLLSDPAQFDGMPYGEIHNAAIQRVGEGRARSYAQLGLYWACCKLVADNTEDVDWNTAKKVDEMCKIAARHVDFWVHYQNRKTGETWCNIRTKSISFAELAHIEACGYFDQAFQSMADKLGITVDELEDAAKRRMGGGEAA